MKQAETLIRGEDSVLTAVSRMRESGRPALYAVDPHPDHRCQGGIIGLVTDQDVARAAQDGTGQLERAG